MNALRIAFVVRAGVAAAVVAFLLAYAAHDDFGISSVDIREWALLASVLIGSLVAIDFLARNLRSRSSLDLTPPGSQLLKVRK
jgi:hypothetical protein